MNLHRKHSIRKTTPSEVVKVTKKGSSLHLAKTNVLLHVVTIEFTKKDQNSKHVGLPKDCSQPKSVYKQNKRGK